MESNPNLEGTAESDVEAEVSDEAQVDVERDIEVQTGGISVEREADESDEAERTEG